MNWKRPLLACTVLMAGWGLPAMNAEAADHACAGVDTHLTDARRHEYASLIAASVTIKVKPSAVDFQNFMTAGAWSAAYVSMPDSEPGFFFFETVDGRKRFKDVWGGFADPEDRPELIKWATALGAPATLAGCFAHTVTN